jgi:hypothetical protein
MTFVDCLFLFFLWVVSTCVFFCLVLLINRSPSLISIYMVFSHETLKGRTYVDLITHSPLDRTHCNPMCIGNNKPITQRLVTWILLLFGKVKIPWHHFKAMTFILFHDFLEIIFNCSHYLIALFIYNAKFSLWLKFYSMPLF